jgi:hypothetical protein
MTDDPQGCHSSETVRRRLDGAQNRETVLAESWTKRESVASRSMRPAHESGPRSRARPWRRFSGFSYAELLDPGGISTPDRIASLACADRTARPSDAQVVGLGWIVTLPRVHELAPGRFLLSVHERLGVMSSAAVSRGHQPALPASMPVGSRGINCWCDSKRRSDGFRRRS